jgi:hypothetical protein
VFILLSFVLNSFPFLLILSIDANTTRRFFPSRDDGTLIYGYILHIVALLMSIQCIILAISMKLLKKRKDTEMCRIMRIATCINGIVIVVESLLTFLIGILYINSTITMLEKCSISRNFYTDPATKPCLTICVRGNDDTKLIGTKANCERFLLDVRENPPIELYCLTSVTMLVVFSLGHFFIYKMFGEYSEKMFLHHLCLKEFKESPASKRLVKNLPPMDIIKETDENDPDNHLSNTNTPPHVRKLR